MKVISPKELALAGAFFKDIEVFPESWATRKKFSLYQDAPRPCSALFFVKTGIRVHFLAKNGDKITVEKGGVAYIPQGLCYRAEVEGGTLGEIDTYTVNHTLVDSEGESLLLSDTLTILCQRAEGKLDMHFQKLDEAVHRESGRLRVAGRFYTLLDAVMTAAGDHNDAFYAIRAGAVLLREEWHRNERIEKYAALCGVSNAYFYRCFRAWCGQSPVEYRNALRLSHAQTMLRNTDMQVREIAETVGFDDPFYFCRVFSKKFGVSPQKYRNGSF